MERDRERERERQREEKKRDVVTVSFRAANVMILVAMIRSPKSGQPSSLPPSISLPISLSPFVGQHSKNVPEGMVVNGLQDFPKGHFYQLACRLVVILEIDIIELKPSHTKDVFE